VLLFLHESQFGRHDRQFLAVASKKVPLGHEVADATTHDSFCKNDPDGHEVHVLAEPEQVAQVVAQAVQTPAALTNWLVLGQELTHVPFTFLKLAAHEVQLLAVQFKQLLSEQELHVPLAKKVFAGQVK